MNPRCRCYVRDLPPEESFAIRDGAHAVDCPVYRPSGDPVDRVKDAHIRETLAPTFTAGDLIRRKIARGRDPFR